MMPCMASDWVRMSSEAKRAGISVMSVWTKGLPSSSRASTGSTGLSSLVLLVADMVGRKGVEESGDLKSKSG